MMNRRLFKHVLSISKIIARRTSTKLHVTVVDDTPFMIKQYNKKRRNFSTHETNKFSATTCIFERLLMASKLRSFH